MEQVLKALKDRGLNAELQHTGGGIMVAFISAGEKIIGVDEWTVCVYDSEQEYEDCVFSLEDDDLEDEIRILELANFASHTFNALKGAN